MVDNWSTVMATKRLRVGGYSANSLCYVSFGFGLKSSMYKGDIYIVQMLCVTFYCFLCKGDIMQNPTGKVPKSHVHLGASEDARRLALILFKNVTLFSKNSFCKTHLRKARFYKDILKLENVPNARKCTQIYDAFKIIETEARNVWKVSLTNNKCII